MAIVGISRDGYMDKSRLLKISHAGGLLPTGRVIKGFIPAQFFMMNKKKIKDHGAYISDETFRGSFDSRTTAVVMNNHLSVRPGRPMKIKVAYYLTENERFFTGQTTVALFRIKQKEI